MNGKHGGNLRTLARHSKSTDRLLDFSANINPLGPPAWLRPVLSRAVEELVAYPDPECVELREACAAAWSASLTSILPGNGESELIQLLPRALAPARVLIPSPAYVDYASASRAAGIEPVTLATRADFTVDYDRLNADLRAGDLVFLGHPANPAGTLLDLDRVLQLARTHGDSTFAIDEAFIDFVADEPSLLKRLKRNPAGAIDFADTPNVIILRSFTKFYAVPGLRLGCLLAAPAIVEQVQRQQADWSVNALAQAVGMRALQDTEYAEHTRARVKSYREELVANLNALPGQPFRVHPAVANYLLLKREDGGTAEALNRTLLADHGVAVRVCNNYDGLGPEYLRVAVRTPAENERLLRAIRATLNLNAAAIESPGVSATAASAVVTPRLPKRKARPLMIQGTASNAGKSLLTAAFCRILLEDGLRVAPFKSQNMSLNSFVTAQGGEVARAQAVQAGACRLDPDVRMSPVLLKPGSETGSQVIVAGKPVGFMKVREYQAYKKTAWDEVRSCYDSLADEFDAVVLEGAGSPGEVNLKQHDIVNMKMARYAEAPVLLAGDIDRGGVFAGFVGTMEVLEEWERKLVAGFLVNRFRGDATLLGPALDFMFDTTGRPVLGVIPYLPGHGLPEEDSVNFKDSSSFFAPRRPDGSADGREQSTGQGGEAGAKRNDSVDIALIDLPFISNFTDFEPLSREPDVHLRIVRRGDTLGQPDLVIIPGTKNSLHDLDYLNESGFGGAIRELVAREATSVVGVCGGLQMLGRSIHDPGHIESNSGSRAGLGLLDLETTLAPEKTLRQVTARHTPSGLDVRGYEIHHGQTIAPRESTIMEVNGEVGGVADARGRVWGTYLHGVFDGDEFRRWCIDSLRERRGLAALGEIQVRYDLEPAFERLAAHVRANVDMDKIYQVMGL